jgi:hypothetical protein
LVLEWVPSPAVSLMTSARVSAPKSPAMFLLTDMIARSLAADLPPSGVTYYQLPKEYGVTKYRYTVVMIVPSRSIGHSPHRSGNRINESPRVTKVRPFLFFLRIVRCPHLSLIFSPIAFFLVGGTAPNRMPVAFFLNGVHPSFPLRHWSEHGTK